MNEQYLWDASGEPDPEILAIENALRPLSFKRRKRKMRLAAAAIAALIPIAAAGLWIAHVSTAASSWQLSLNGSSLRPLRIGQQIDTGDTARAVLESESTGRVDIGPGSHLRLMEDRQGAETFSLERGELHAFIWAPPRTFVVETPSARTVDLGCQYTLSVAENGSGTLRVETGWVAFTAHGRDSFIPAGAMCETHPDRGPGTPFFEDAPGVLKRALGRVDQGDESALNDILSNARKEDALSLWHLMTRVSPPARGRVFDRFAQLVALPPNITRADIERGDPAAIDAAWNALHLGSAAWWRGWERRW